MKELQKYTPSQARGYEVYIAHEADAAFEEKDAHHKQVVEILEKRIARMRENSAFIDTKHAEEIERLKAEHEATLRRQADAALSGMDAAKKISSHQLELASRLHKESNPEAIDSERRANAILTEENERLRERVAYLEASYIDGSDLRKQAERYEKLRKVTPTTFERIFWDSDDTDSSFDALVDQLPASGEASVDEQAGRVE